MIGIALLFYVALTYGHNIGPPMPPYRRMKRKGNKVLVPAWHVVMADICGVPLIDYVRRYEPEGL